MALITSPKIALHLYLNNPYGLISAAIPNYTINTVNVTERAGPSPIVRTDSRSSISPKKFNVQFGDRFSSQLDLLPSKPVIKHLKDVKHHGDVNQNKDEITKTQQDKDELTKMPRKTPLPDVRSSSRCTNGSKYVPYPSPTPVYYDKTPRSKSSSPENEGVHVVPTLGFTWSLNTDRREKVVPIRKQPPDSLLEKLGKMKLGDPVGIIKLKREKLNPALYNIHRLTLNDKTQRKMSERLHEWLDQYTEVSQKQQAYLQRISDLRKSLQTKEDKHVIETIDKMRTGPRYRHKRKYPLYSLTRMEEAPVNQGPSPFPSRPSHFQTDDKHGLPRLNIAPNTQPRKLAPLVKRVKTNKYNKSPSPDQFNTILMDLHQDTPRPEMAKMKTEYEPFEAIAKRNSLNLTQFFNSSLSHRRSHERMPLNVSRVTIINEVPEGEREPKTFITDFSSRKPLVNGLKKSKPG